MKKSEAFTVNSCEWKVGLVSASLVAGIFALAVLSAADLLVYKMELYDVVVPIHFFF